MSCNVLKPIRAHGQKWGSREVTWRPVAHGKVVHKSCGEIVDYDDPERETATHVCRKHGAVDANELETALCSGDKQDIR